MRQKIKRLEYESNTKWICTESDSVCKEPEKAQHIKCVFVSVCVIEVSPVRLIKQTHRTKPNKYDAQQIVVYY